MKVIYKIKTMLRLYKNCLYLWSLAKLSRKIYVNLIIMSFFVDNVINSLLFFVVIYIIINFIVIIWLCKLIPSLFIELNRALVIFMMTKTELYKESIFAEF